MVYKNLIPKIMIFGLGFKLIKPESKKPNTNKNKQIACRKLVVFRKA